MNIACFRRWVLSCEYKENKVMTTNEAVVRNHLDRAGNDIAMSKRQAVRTGQHLRKIQASVELATREIGAAYSAEKQSLHTVFPPMYDVGFLRHEVESLIKIMDQARKDAEAAETALALAYNMLYEMQAHASLLRRQQPQALQYTPLVERTRAEFESAPAPLPLRP
jgi:hypothetical protein